jgi:SAM-dependent methyltransferase
LRRVAHQYPTELIEGQVRDIPRIASSIGLLARRGKTAGAVCDLGGGLGLFSVGCAAAGYDVTLVDDFSDSVNERYKDLPSTLHRRLGVRVVPADVVAAPPDFAPSRFDAVTTFDSLEHRHHSPKKLLARVVNWLRPGGLLVIGVPNCVNLRKRITVPFGRGKWSRVEDWYEVDNFRGHVREPDTDDLRYIARDLRLEHVEIIGRNWLGYVARSSMIRSITPFIDVPLRMLPGLCSDIYLLGQKPLTN